MNTINSIVFIGAGNVATNLAVAFYKVDKKIIQVYSRNIDKAKILAQTVNADYTDNISNINSYADLYIISINDDAIINIASSLKIKNKLIVHTSGSVDMDVFENIFDNYGVFYPLQTFSKETIVDFKTVPFCIEANTIENRDQLTNLASFLSEDIRFISSDERKSIHLAAVFACNFTNYMYSIAYDILDKKNISFDILKPLIQQTAGNIINQKPENIQTGPAKRNDQQLIDKQISILKDTPEYSEIYKIITQNIINKYHK